jgi:hypothetical protein
MTNKPMMDLLLESGYTDGWAICGEVLVLWEHNTDPPKPLTRPIKAQTEDVQHFATTSDHLEGETQK